jgi:hypothetical protein
MKHSRIQIVWVLVLVASLPVRAQYDVLPVSGRNELFHDYLVRELDSLIAKRNEAAEAALATPESVMARQQELRTRYMELLGDFPEKTPRRPTPFHMIPA